jgi:hypothetical protein
MASTTTASTLATLLKTSSMEHRWGWVGIALQRIDELLLGNEVGHDAQEVILLDLVVDGSDVLHKFMA